MQGKERGVIHDTYADCFHGKYGCGQRRAENSGKGGAHAAHDDDMAVLFIQADQMAEPVSNAAADLDGSPPHGLRFHPSDESVQWK